MGGPWVAQRVWPMPTLAVSGLATSTASRFFSLPAARRRSMRPPAHHGGDPGRVVAAILQPPQALNQPILDRRFAHNADDAAHVAQTFFVLDATQHGRSGLLRL